MKREWSEGRETPQGGVVSPILSNVFLHYAFDLWMTRTHPNLPWCRYADDGLVHCRTEQEAQALKADLQARLAVCRLKLHRTKTKIVYCKERASQKKSIRTSNLTSSDTAFGPVG
jgi:RNA-directed DNA polymerase